MPVNDTNDLNYQPPIKPIFYSPPKIPITKRLTNLLSFTFLPFVFLIKTIKKLLIFLGTSFTNIFKKILIFLKAIFINIARDIHALLAKIIDNILIVFRRVSFLLINLLTNLLKIFRKVPILLINLLNNLLIVFRKVPILLIKLFIKLLKKILEIFFILLPEILIFGIIFTVFLFILNYFNVLSLSELYPDYFYNLPHQSFPDQANINKILIKDPKNFDKNNSYWNISGTFLKIDRNIIYLKYNGEVATLARGSDIACWVKKKLPSSQSNYYTIKLCSNAFFREITGKSVFVNFITRNNIEFIIENIYIE